MADNHDSGFEYLGVFYPWYITQTGKDLLLIDRISGMPPQDFFELVEDKYDLSRSTVTLTLIATSMRNRHPERSLERIVRTVMEMSLDEIEIVGGDDEEATDVPSQEAGETPAPSSETSSSTSNGSPAVTSATLPEILV